MKILVTGAAGQIGCGISRLLIEKEHELVLVDNLRNGYVDNLKKDGKFIAPFQYLDISKPFVLDGKFDAIIHLAAISNDPIGEKFSKITNEINFQTTVELGKKAKTAEINKFIFVHQFST